MRSSAGTAPIDNVPTGGDSPFDGQPIPLAATITGGHLSPPLPAGWNSQKIAAPALYPGRAVEIRLSLSDGRITVDTQAGPPIRAFRDSAAIPRQLLEPAK